MNPHSRISQYNQRPPRSGPEVMHTRELDNKSLLATLEGFSKKASSRASSISRELTPTPIVRRPIASNSRVRKDEQNRKDMYLAFVNNALTQRNLGNSESFDELVNQFNPKRLLEESGSPPSRLRLWILALSHVVSQLDKPYVPLVEAIVAFPWTTLDSVFVKTFVSFLGSLVSARPEYLSLVLDKAVESLTHQSGLKAMDNAFAEGSSSPLTRRAVYDRVHALLQHLLSIIPTLPSSLHPILVRHFPHKRQSQACQVTYIRNLLRLSEYCPELADRILGLIVDRTIQIDVEIQVELEDVETKGEPEAGEVFSLDIFDTVVGQEGDESDSGSEDGDSGDDGFSDLSSDFGDEDEQPAGVLEAPINVSHIQDMVQKLDGILDVIFNHFRKTDIPSTIPHPSSKDTIRADQLDAQSAEEDNEFTERQHSRFMNLLSIFDRTVLRTFKSRYTQFLVFWYASLDPEFSDLLQGLLVSKALLEVNLPAVTRAAAASYAGSFVSRALFVDRASARRVVGVICDFLRSHLDSYDASVVSKDSLSLSSEQKTVFYAVAQALFLIFCFRWRDLMEENEDADNPDISVGSVSGPRKNWMPELDVVQRLVSSPLNPLQVCSQNVVLQFARVAQRVGFIYVFSILDANKRSEYFSTRPLASPLQSNPRDGNEDVYSPVLLTPLVSTGSVTSTDLTTFFPFDPYRLPKSSSYMQDIYREWSSVALDDESDEEDDEDSDEEAENGSHVGGVPIKPSLSEDGTLILGQSFEGMSISPIHHRVSIAV